VAPRRYELVLEPDLDTARFTGTVRIDAEVLAPTDRIVLHALDLELGGAVVRAGDTEHRVEPVLDAEHETATLPLDGPLPVGPVTVELGFAGELNDRLLGFYRSTFRLATDDGGSVEHTLAVTQFESTHARRAFPCFDEPAMKAVFSLTLVVAADLFVVANTAEVARDVEPDGRVRVRFADTIPMSTYLVAFVVGPLVATEARLVEGLEGPIPLRVVHPPGSEHLCGFALDVAEAGLRFFERYYELPYPGDKVDLVAVPDFAFGAMENLGCITFREVLLLVDPDAATQPELQRVADVINHELAHMWFGDLVTMSWWNGIWLNEAFATFMEITATDAFRPDWDVWTTFGLARAAAFDTDTLRSTRPIEFEVVTAADAEGMFDILTYEKGASVLRMLEQYLGAEVFRAGIAAYLRTHAFANTETSDLWDALEAASGEPVRRIMDAWIFRGGHPLVRATPTGRGVRLSQTRASFLADAPAEEPWPIPVVLDASTDTDRRGDAAGTHRLLLEQEAELDLGAPARVVQANVAGNGFYRVELDPELRAAAAADPSATALERFVLLDDTAAGLLAGRVDLRAVAELVRALAAGESDPAVWRRLAAAARELVRLAGEEHRGTARAFVRSISLAPLDAADAELAGTPHDGPEPPGRPRERRGVLFALAGADGEHEPVRRRAAELFDAGTGDDADPALTAAAIEVVAAAAGPAEHGELERRWRDAASPQEELRYLNALVDTDDPALFGRAIELALTEVRTQNAPYLLRRAISHPTLGALAWDRVSGAWERVTERFPSNSLPRMLEGIRSITDRELAGRVEAFLAHHPTPSGERLVAQHVERMWVTVTAALRVRGELAEDPDAFG
jgi:puromycin-sensitive aminopeptidase